MSTADHAIPWLPPAERAEGAELLALLPAIVGPIPLEITAILRELVDHDTDAAGLVLVRLREVAR